MKLIRAPPRSWAVSDRIFVAYLFGIGLDFSEKCGILVVKKNSKKG
ncbi:hypothetical protein [Acutalibacter caecimuris]|nr:hypothetical protein [Acutalibacter sp. M00118]